MSFMDTLSSNFVKSLYEAVRMVNRANNMRVKVTDKYCITSDDICFRVCKVSIAKSGKHEGEETDSAIGYYSSMLNALEKVRQLLIYDELGDKSLDSVETYIAEVDRITNNFRTDTERILKEYHLNLTTGDLYNGKTSL